MLFEKSTSRIIESMDKPFAIITAFRHENSLRENRELNRQLAKDLRLFMDVGGLSLVGYWRESPDVSIDWREVPFNQLIEVKEESFWVSIPDDITFEEFKGVITLLTSKYKQDASIISDGEDIYFLDKNGGMQKFASNIRFNNKTQGYSMIKGKSHAFTFSEGKMGLRDVIREEIQAVMNSLLMEDDSQALARLESSGDQLPDNAQWTNRFEIRSQSSNRVYVVSQNKKSGKWACSCPGWIRYKKCKHLSSLGFTLSDIHGSNKLD